MSHNLPTPPLDHFSHWQKQYAHLLIFPFISKFLFSMTPQLILLAWSFHLKSSTCLNFNYIHLHLDSRRIILHIVLPHEKIERFTIMFILVSFLSQKADNKLHEGPPCIFSSTSLTPLDYLTLSWGHKTKYLLSDCLSYISQYYGIWEDVKTS